MVIFLTHLQKMALSTFSFCVLKLPHSPKNLIQRLLTVSTCNDLNPLQRDFHRYQPNYENTRQFFLGDSKCLVSDAHASFQSRRHVHGSEAKRFIYEADRKGGYGKPIKMSRLKMVREGLKEMKQEIILWTDEVKETFMADPFVVYRPGEVDVVWKFGTPEVHSKWVTTADSDHGEGLSECELSVSPSGGALFSGTLSTQVPRDGRIKRAGYCNMRSMRARKSFKRDSYLDWSMYTHLVLRVRGDGRSYMLNLATCGTFDIMWNDMFNYILFTRGGPYWQVAKIPFSKFFLASKGRIQDKQCPVPLNRISNVGISVGDKVNGPFSLEIDYIGVEFDPSHSEEFAYEMYRLPNHVAGT